MEELLPLENEKIDVLGKYITIKEWEGMRVITAYDIAYLHDKEVKKVNQQFTRNKKKFTKNVDYFELTKEEMSQSQFVTALSKYSNNAVERLFTERGYLKLTKTFNDDLSWKIQDILVDSYFKLQQIANSFKTPKNYIEALEFLIAAEKEKEKLQLENNQQKQIIAEYEPKATYCDLVLKSPNLVSISLIAKDYGMSAIAFNKLLHDLGIQYKQSGTWLLYQKYANFGYTKSTTYLDEKTGFSKLNTKWSQKGRLFIYETLKANEILPLIEKE